jgi:ribosomal protein S18 acetylase RimI-like enzyme
MPPCGGSEVRIGELDLVTHAGTALAIQAAALATVGNLEVGPAHGDSYLRHTAHPGFLALGAWHEDVLVGFAYGHADAGGQWWHDEIEPALRQLSLDGWQDDAYVLVELHVRPDHHGRGLGPQLLRGLLGSVPQRRAVLSTDDLDTPARRLYRRTGFMDLLTGFHFSTTRRPFAIMGAALPLWPQEESRSG